MDRCKGCVLCVSVCPKAALEMAGGLNSRGYHYAVIPDQERCIGCLLCAVICPDAAIEIERLPATAAAKGRRKRTRAKEAVACPAS